MVKNLKISFFPLVTMHAFDRQTDGRIRQTDRILIVRPRLHYMQRGKNVAIIASLNLMYEFICKSPLTT